MLLTLADELAASLPERDAERSNTRERSGRLRHLYISFLVIIDVMTTHILGGAIPIFSCVLKH